MDKDMKPHGSLTTESEEKKKPRWWARLWDRMENYATWHPAELLVLNVILIAIAIVCTVINQSRIPHL